MPLKVIGAGFGRTGTDSMREALNLLGFGPCHHMFEVAANPVMKARWRALMNHGLPDWEALFEGYRSCVDWPSAFYWRELVAEYPDARVILTWRDPDSWWTSYESTLLKYFQTTEDRDAVGFRIIGKTFGDRASDRDYVIGVYKAHVEEVIATVPEERLLLHRIGDGWKPLCKFLGVSIPPQSYPQRNSTAQINKRIGSP